MQSARSLQKSQWSACDPAWSLRKQLSRSISTSTAAAQSQAKNSNIQISFPSRVLSIEPAPKSRPLATGLETNSVPELIHRLREDWDTVSLETNALKQHVFKLRKELSHALYQQDAACRVISRLLKERDEARK